MDTILGHLTLRFGSSQAENMATERLHFLREKSGHARRIFHGVLRQSGLDIPGELAFCTQAADADGAIPDLVGRDANGNEAVIVESKFWAGLTSRQPTAGCCCSSRRPCALTACGRNC